METNLTPEAGSIFQCLASSIDGTLTPESGFTIDWSRILRAIAGVSSALVEVAYTYENLSWFDDTPTLQGYSNLTTIWVQETFDALDSESAGLARSERPSVRSIHIDGNTCFGFAAQAQSGDFNVLALRGTNFAEEDYFDVVDWTDTTPCNLPTQSDNPTSYGTVNESLYDFYTGDDLASLAGSCFVAINAVESANPGKPWLFAAHSLGGPILTMLALDVVASGILGNRSPGVVTFGSLHIGYKDFVKEYNEKVPATLRMANLSDFVPGFVGISPGAFGSSLYVHVGIEATFTWQTWSDWDNHSLTDMYMKVVQDFWSDVTIGPRNLTPVPASS